MKSEKLILFSVCIAVFLICGCVNPPNNEVLTPPGKAVSVSDFAKCLTEKGVTVYGFGTSWCTFCTEQEKMFGNAWKDLNYIECSISENFNEQSELCNKAGIRGYPTWVLKGGEKIEGTFSFDVLSQRTGCPAPTIPSQPNTTDLNNEVPVVNNQQLKFDVVQPLPAGTVGEQYNYSFCKPDLTSASDLCAGSEITNPSGGNPPYHFVLDSGAFAPMGLSLNLNGLLSGKPTTEGESTFSVCAVDQSGTQTCKQVTLGISQAVAKPETWTGKMTGTYTRESLLGGGEYGYDFSVSFTVPKSIIANFKDPANTDDWIDIKKTSGTIAETTTVLQQLDTTNNPGDLMVGGSLNEPIQVGVAGSVYQANGIFFVSPTGKELIAGYLQRDGAPFSDSRWSDIKLTVTNYTDTTITGTWGTGLFGELVAHGTFTLNKQ